MTKKEKEKQFKEWKKELKNVYDWDYSGLLLVLKYQLHRMQELFENSDIHIGNKKIAKQIKTAETLINNVYDNKYENENYDKMEKKYGKLDFKVVGKNEASFTRNKVKDEEKYRKDSLQGHKKAEIAKKKDLAKAFNIICDNLWNWWD